MSCIVMKYESLAALANAVEARLNCDYNFWGFDAPDSLYRAFEDCRTVRLYSAEDIYNRLYMLNAKAYNERYKNHEEAAVEKAPIIDGSRYIIHHRPEYREHGFAVRPWHYYLAALLDCWLYQTLEGVVKNDPRRLAMRDFRDSLYGFIIRNSPPYTAVRFGELPPYLYREESKMRKLFFRLGATMELTQEEFELVCTSSDTAHDFLRDKVARDEFKLDGETYSPANLSPCDNEFYHKDDIEFEF